MMRQLQCWSCGKTVPLPDGPVGFRAECDHCGVYLHCCKGCQHYSPGKPNDCLIPDTDLIKDREQFNFCEEFEELGSQRRKGSDAADAAKRLFGDDDDPPEKKSFDDLFG